MLRTKTTVTKSSEWNTIFHCPKATCPPTDLVITQIMFPEYIGRYSACVSMKCKGTVMSVFHISVIWVWSYMDVYMVMIWKAVRNSFSSSVRVSRLAGDTFLLINPAKVTHESEHQCVDLHWGYTTAKRSDKLIAGSSISLSFQKRQQRKPLSQTINSDILSPLIHVTILVLRHHQQTIIFAFNWEVLIGWWRRPLFL